MRVLEEELPRGLDPETVRGLECDDALRVLDTLYRTVLGEGSPPEIVSDFNGDGNESLNDKRQPLRENRISSERPRGRGRHGATPFLVAPSNRSAPALGTLERF